MRYAEKENFLRVIRWDSPSHVCYPPPSRGLSYRGAWPADCRPSPEATQWRDDWGVTWTDLDGEVFPTGPAIGSINELGCLRPPDPRDPRRFETVRAALAGIDRDACFVSVNHPYFLYEKGFNLLGAEEFLVSFLADPAAAERLLDAILDFELGIAEGYVQLRPDHVNLSDDYGMQDRLAVSPEVWRAFFKPRLKRMVDFYRNALGPETVVSLHSCGHVLPILGDLIEIGIDILNPVQSTANDLAEARRVTSGRLVLCGGIDGQHVLPLGTPEQVREEVLAKMDLLWEDGGYLPLPEKLLGVPDANRKAMDQAIHDWSAKYVEQREERERG